MLLTVIFGEQVSYIEVSPEIELENFIGLCLIEIPSLASIPFSSLRLVFNGVGIAPTAMNMPKQIQTFGLSDGDAISIEQVPAASQVPAQNQRPVQQSSQNIPSGSSNQPDIASLVSNLVKNIKVPTSASVSQRDKQMAKNIFDSLGNPARLDVLRSFAPELADIYEKNPKNFEAFHQAFLKHKAEQERRARLMHDENSEEGQRFIAEQIERENIDFTHQFAMEHMPEAFVPVHMLYIRMKINNHPVMAFVDSGAQVSILSESCAKRCNIFRLVDTRFRMTAMGVGGSQKFVGRIHSCQVQVEGHIFPCSFDVMGDRNVDILFGLNVLRRHQCDIDLKKGVLRFSDGTETPFLDEEAYRREMEAIDHEEMENAIDDSKKQGGMQS